MHTKSTYYYNKIINQETSLYKRSLKNLDIKVMEVTQISRCNSTPAGRTDEPLSSNAECHWI